MEKHLVEYGAMDGVAIVMETETGKIRAMVGLEAKGILPMLEQIPWLLCLDENGLRIGCFEYRQGET